MLMIPAMTVRLERRRSREGVVVVGEDRELCLASECSNKAKQLVRRGFLADI